MSISISLGDLEQPAERRSALDPQLLMDEGILRDPRVPEQAVKRARTLLDMGRFNEVRELLSPHRAINDGETALQIRELLAKCAMYSGDGDWQGLLHQTLEGFLQQNDLAGAARIRFHLGEMNLAVGQFNLADLFLQQAERDFESLADSNKRALVDCLRAQLRLRSGFVDQALQRLDRALALLASQEESRPLALIRLERARILSYRGESSAAIRELMAAERVLSISHNRVDQINARATRAEMLLSAGQHKRAAQGLQRILEEALTLEQMSVTAWVHNLLGLACVEQNPTVARHHLIRSRNLYKTLHFNYHVASCDITLVQVETRLNLNPELRLASLADCDLREWPLLATRLQLARIDCGSKLDRDQTREELLRARTLALASGNRSLAKEIEVLLKKHGLLEISESDITPVIFGATEVVSSMVPAPLKLVPMEIDNDSPSGVMAKRKNAPAIDVSLELNILDQPKTAAALREPRATGIGGVNS